MTLARTLLNAMMGLAGSSLTFDTGLFNALSAGPGIKKPRHKAAGSKLQKKVTEGTLTVRHGICYPMMVTKRMARSMRARMGG